MRGGAGAARVRATNKLAPNDCLRMGVWNFWDPALPWGTVEGKGRGGGMGQPDACGTNVPSPLEWGARIHPGRKTRPEVAPHN